MKKLVLFTALLCCRMMYAAPFRMSPADTLWMNNDYEKVVARIATVFGVVQSVDEETNEATVQFFLRENARLLSVQHRVASGNGMGLKTGKQVYYDEQGHVQSTEEYELIDGPKGKKLNRLVSEVLFNPDGSVSEEITFEYKKGEHSEYQTYVRQCYYLDGQLRYKESMDKKGTKTLYYTEKGKKDKHPALTYDPYMTMPEFPGGQKRLIDYLSATVKYPAVARANGIQGSVLVQFTVDKDGAVGDVTVLRSGGDPSLNREAVRVVNSMPNWIPGTKRGKPIRVRYTLPVNFRLQ